MARTYLSPAQQQRSRHIHKAHDNMKNLAEAAADAVKYHDKYMKAMETVMNCLRESGEVWRVVRTQLEPEGTMVTAVGPSSARLAASFNRCQVSQELRSLRDQLQKLRDTADAGQLLTKKAKTHAEELDKEGAADGLPMLAKTLQRTTESSKTVEQKQRAEHIKHQERMASLELTVANNVRSTAAWWSARLVGCCDEMYANFHKLGQRTVASFPPPAAAPAPAPAARVAPSQAPRLAPPPPAAASRGSAGQSIRRSSQPPSARLRLNST